LELPDDHDGFKALPSIDSIDDIPGDDDMTEPMKFHLEIKIEGDDQTNPKGLDNFVSEFKNDPCYMVEFGASGRGSRMVVKHIVNLNNLVKEVLDRGTEAKAKLSGAEREWVDAPWFFSYHGKMKSVGCEYAFFRQFEGCMDRIKSCEACFLHADFRVYGDHHTERQCCIDQRLCYISFQCKTLLILIRLWM
jgi:hypothetical protein